MEKGKKDILLIREKLISQVREHMKKNNITQEELAARTGFTQSNVNRMLMARYSPTLDNMIILCRAMGLAIELRSTMYSKGGSSAIMID